MERNADSLHLGQMARGQLFEERHLLRAIVTNIHMYAQL